MTNEKPFRRIAGLGALATAVAAAGVYLANPARAVQHGDPTPASAHPYAVALMLDGAGYGKQYCSGTLIAPTKVITAGHCYDPYPPRPDVPYPPEPRKEADRWTVVAGRDDLRSTTTGAEAKVTRIWIDPRYYTDDVDLAIMTLDRPLPYQPLPVAGPDDAALYAEGTPATLFGWGLDETRQLPTGLNSASLAVHDAATCTAIFAKLPHPRQTFETGRDLCAGTGGEGNPRPDKHDSGGTLEAGGKLVGVTWGSDLVDGPYCYTKMATFKAAIDAEVARS